MTRYFSLISFLTLCMFSQIGAADVYVVHGVPGADVDVYVNGDMLLEDFQYTDIQGPVPVPGGEYLIEVFLTGANPGEEDPVIMLETTLLEEQSVSIVAHLTETGELKLTPFGNPAGRLSNVTSRVAVRHTAQAPSVDVQLRSRFRFIRGAFVFSVSNGAGATAVVYPISYDLAVVPPGSNETVLGPVPVYLRAGFSYAAYAVGNPAENNFTILLQEFDSRH